VRLVLKFSLATLIGLGGCLFWPRSSSLSAFDAAAMAGLHISLWRHAADGEEMPTLLDLYGILNGQYRIPPLPAMAAAVSTLQAQKAFASAADEADEEKALPFLEKSFSLLGEKTETLLDPAIIARLELFTWSLARAPSKERQLAAAISEKLALLHGGAAQEYQAAALSFAHARRSAAAKNWSAASEAEAAAWQKLRHHLDSRSAQEADQRAVAPSAGSSRSSQL
jgi:hypothetical protein